MRKENLGKKTKILWKNPEYREHMKRAHLGQKAWNKGIKTGLVPKTAFAKGHKNSKNWYKAMVKIRNENHHNWKENNVGYVALHGWVKRNLGKAKKCSNPNCFYPRKGKNGKLLVCPKIFYWANISGEYKRDLSDWHELCQSCNQSDGISKNKRFKIL